MNDLAWFHRQSRQNKWIVILDEQIWSATLNIRSNMLFSGKFALKKEERNTWICKEKSIGREAILLVCKLSFNTFTLEESFLVQFLLPILLWISYSHNSAYFQLLLFWGLDYCHWTFMLSNRHSYLCFSSLSPSMMPICSYIALALYTTYQVQINI